MGSYRAPASAPAAALVGLAPDRTIRSWDEGAELLFGYGPGEVIGRGIELLVPHERAREVVDILARAAAGETVTAVTVRVAKSGQPVDVRVTAAPIRHATTGVVLGHALTYAPVRPPDAPPPGVDRLGEARPPALAEEILESISDAFFAVDAGFRFTYVNARMEELWSRRRDELLGRNVWDVFPQAVGSEPYAMLQRAMLERCSVHFEAVSPVLGCWLDVSAYPESGGGLSCYFRDITDRKRAEAERERLLAAEASARADAERARAEAQAANAAKTRLLAATSHDLRSPVVAIAGYTELLAEERYGPVTPAQRVALEKIKRAHEHLLTLVDDILRAARGAPDPRALRVGDVPVAAVCAAVYGVAAPQAAAKQLRYTCDSQAPRADGALVARGDGERMLQILLNLVGNAVRYTEPGGAISVDVDGDATHVFVRVRDTGRGIPAEQREVIFLPFVRGSFADAQEGLGLGLATSRELARSMGGDITVESEVGVGSTFTLVLPRAAAG